MSYYYVTVNKETGKVVSTTSHISIARSLEFADDNEVVLEVTERQYNLIRACGGDIEKGIFIFHEIQEKINRAINFE